MLTLRPHHLLDIIAQYGAGHPFTPSPMGHAVHSVAESVIADPEQAAVFIAGADDICAPCRNLVDGRCIDVLSQLDPPVSKQDYNDDLDRRLLALLGMVQGDSITVRAFMRMVEARLDDVIAICAHPGEDGETKLGNLRSGIERLG